MTRASLRVLAASLLACGPAAAQQVPIDPALAQGLSDAASLSGVRRGSSQQISRQTMSTINARVGRVSERSRGDLYATAFYNDTGVTSGFGDFGIAPEGMALVSTLKAATGTTSDRASRVDNDLFQFLVGADYQFGDLSLGALASYARFDVRSTPGPLLARLGAIATELEGDAWLGAAYANYLFTPNLYSTLIAAYGEASSRGSESRYVALEGSLNAIGATGPLVVHGRAGLRRLEIEFDNPALAVGRQRLPQLGAIFDSEVTSDFALLGADATWLLSPRVQPFLRTSYEIALEDIDEDGLFTEAGAMVNFTETTGMSVTLQWASFSGGVSNTGVALGFRAGF